MKRFLIAAACVMMFVAGYAQKKSSGQQVLFTVGNEKTTADEFM